MITSISHNTLRVCFQCSDLTVSVGVVFRSTCDEYWSLFPPFAAAGFFVCARMELRSTTVACYSPGLKRCVLASASTLRDVQHSLLWQVMPRCQLIRDEPTSPRSLKFMGVRTGCLHVYSGGTSHSIWSQAARRKTGGFYRTDRRG